MNRRRCRPRVLTLVLLIVLKGPVQPLASLPLPSLTRHG
jgi:hypothetical protein